MVRARSQLVSQSRQSSLPVTRIRQNQHKRKKQTKFLAMPLDMVFEILDHLSPKDLVALSRTSSVLRETLYSQSMTIWKSARIRTGLPECAPGFSERQWAVFIFGGTTCQVCGTGDAPQIEFSIRRRVCDACTSTHLVSNANFAERFPAYDPSIMDLIPYTRGGFSRRFFWVPDVQRMGEKWKRLQAFDARRRKIAKKDAATYRAERVAEVGRIMKHAKECQNWLSEFFWKERQEKWNQRCCVIQDQLMRLGYEKQDIPFSILNEPQFHEGEFTTALWESIQPGLVDKVKALQRSRRYQEKCHLHQTREDMLKPLYDAYARSLLPQQWIYLPDIRDLVLFPLFGEIVTAKRSESITSSSFLPAIRALPTLVQTVNTVVKARITSLLEPPLGAVDEPLDLATSVFECAIIAHVGLNFSPSTLKLDRLNFSSVGSCTAAMLVQEAGLDPLRATIVDMDALNLRFVCRYCTHLAAGQLSAPTVGYPWKPAIEHTLASGHMEWEAMSPWETMYIIQAERYSEDNERSWSCNHCAVHFKNWDTKPQVVQHLRDVHGIAFPVEPNDVFWYPGKRRHPPSWALASLPTPGST